MYRYLALVWRSSDEQSAQEARTLAARLQATSPDWSKVVEVDGLMVFHTESGVGASNTRLLSRGSGAVLGTVFHRNCERAATTVAFDESETLSIVDSGGCWLFSHYWGRYVAFVRDPASTEVRVLRDPTGSLPCFLAHSQGVDIIFSDCEDCQALIQRWFSVNWRAIANIMAGGITLFARETALDQIEEILPGESVSFAGGTRHRTIAWNPIDVALRDPIEDFEAAAEELYRTVRSCVHTWAACYPGIVHNLSGGLDSSIVLSCLTSAPTEPAITCIHYFSDGPGEDERRYARTMAKHTGVELIERQLDSRQLKLGEILTARRSPRPWSYLYELEHGRFEVEQAKRRGANGRSAGLFSGSGGDGVFFRNRAELAITDLLFQQAPQTDLLTVAIDAARLSRQSIWPLLASSIRARVFGSQSTWPRMPPSQSRSLVDPRIFEIAQEKQNDLTHLWAKTTQARHVPPGTLFQAGVSVTPPAYYNTFSYGPGPERTFPLLSQPIVELCLRIPSYQHIKLACDRAVARRAFAADLPTSIVRRYLKGYIAQHTYHIFEHNIDFIRTFLLDGELVRNGMLVRETIERYLSGHPPDDQQYSIILHEYVCTEAWLRSWCPR
ncbi:asparagine synthase-related protein [Pandoraea sp. NPDC087047]|uniref:asparagine synthase-related protein n=1 Tax=Pandoraea sp. NPDC087047 TaxID=3364390 RepID=UPI003827357C